MISDSERLEKVGPNIAEDVCHKSEGRVTYRYLSSPAAQKSEKNLEHLQLKIYTKPSHVACVIGREQNKTCSVKVASRLLEYDLIWYT